MLILPTRPLGVLSIKRFIINLSWILSVQQTTKVLILSKYYTFYIHLHIALVEQKMYRVY